ncbi:histidine kinase [Fibrella aestuarina BUZ 2]|uniref:histidine kinase n=1 Tax=Fibrella aestuarina BUZ 2 TaxID=1166018 RepID=I0K2N6_9BACT|nr:ATP-binding protein [Fibrella aestuarina]CCG98389.1 histidine kinase [Fibrella aestuarina BUZ 2]
MQELIDFLSRLTDTRDWPPRWLCGHWTDFHGWLYIGSDLTIWLAYMGIPLILLRFIFIKKGIPLPGVFALFGAFILLCGTSHLVDATMFWWPAYRFNALVRFLTAIVSVATVFALIRYFNEAVGLRTSSEYERELAIRQQILQELSRSNQELEQFAYVASHDLQSPLRTISSYLTLLETNYGGHLDDQGRHLIQTSTAAASRMRVLINDLLTFSHVGSALEFTEVNLQDLVAEILEEQQHEMNAVQATIEVGPLPTLQAGRTELKQLFQNLITNGLKYHRAGVPVQLQVQAKELGNSYQFSVTDNGIGIDPKHYQRVFQLFQRLHGRARYPGTGIGLATCKKIIDIYGGKIWIDSVPGNGSTFYFTIPKHIQAIRQYTELTSLQASN